MQFGVFHDQLSIDGSMVPYLSRHSCKIFMHGKPIRFGYKVWILAGKNGFPYHLKIYTGREDVGTASPLGTTPTNTISSLTTSSPATSY